MFNQRKREIRNEALTRPQLKQLPKPPVSPWVLLIISAESTPFASLVPRLNHSSLQHRDCKKMSFSAGQFPTVCAPRALWAPSKRGEPCFALRTSQAVAAQFEMIF